MPKRRQQPEGGIEEKIESFINKVDGEAEAEPKPSLDKNAKRDFKAIRLPFNQWEYEALEIASKKTNRSKTSFIRNAIMEASEKYI